MKPLDEYHYIEARVKAVSQKAVMVEYEGAEIWLPLSQIIMDDDPIVGSELEIGIKAWLARDKGILE